MSNSEEIQVLLEMCHRVYERGMVHGSGGNISVRSGDGMVITPTGYCLGHVGPADVVTVLADGKIVGGGKPSKEWRMHLGCYRRADVNAVVHVHCTHSVAVSCLTGIDMKCAMPVYTPGYGARVGKLPAVPFMKPGSVELAKAVCAALDGRNSAMLINHGIIAVGQTIEQAFNIADEIEENAHLHLLLGDAGRPLGAHEMALLAGY